jgi:two-component system sensor histidine kinase YesM
MFWKRLLFSYLLVIMLALLFLGIVTYRQMNAALSEQVINSNQIILENGKNILMEYIMDMRDLVLDMTIHTKLQEYMNRFRMGKSMLAYGYLNDIIYEDRYLYSQLSSNNASVSVYPVKNDMIFIYNYTGGGYRPLTEKDNKSHITDAYEKNGGFIMQSFYRDDGNYISFSCAVFDIISWEGPIAVIELEISAKAINSLLYNIKLERNISPYLVDEAGMIFLPYNESAKITDNIMVDRSESPIELENDILIRKNLISTGWKIAGLLPKDQIESKIENVRKTFLFTGLLIALMLVALSIYFATWLSKPLKKLAGRLKQFEEGKFKPLKVKRTYSTEIKILYKQYNVMAARIENLIKQMYQSAEREKEAELQALQAQINPHFLYNTLDSINWMAFKYKAEDIRFMVNSLANMMRYSLNKGRNYITVADEIEQVRNYVGIQEIRYSGKFKTYFEVENDVLDYRIIKLLLQPLVENAILHGFKNTGNYGDIFIKGYADGDFLVFEVINEGDKLDMEKIHQVLHPDKNEKPKGYGIRNVNDRLVKQYGERFELKFYTSKGMTHARIELPLDQLEKGEEYA